MTGIENNDNEVKKIQNSRFRAASATDQTSNEPWENASCKPTGPNDARDPCVPDPFDAVFPVIHLKELLSAQPTAQPTTMGHLIIHVFRDPWVHEPGGGTPSPIGSFLLLVPVFPSDVRVTSPHRKSPKDYHPPVQKPVTCFNVDVAVLETSTPGHTVPYAPPLWSPDPPDRFGGS